MEASSFWALAQYMHGLHPILVLDLCHACTTHCSHSCLLPAPPPCSGQAVDWSSTPPRPCSACTARPPCRSRTCKAASPAAHRRLRLQLQPSRGSSCRAPSALHSGPLHASPHCPPAHPRRCCSTAAAARPQPRQATSCGRRRPPCWRFNWHPRCLSTTAARWRRSARLSGSSPCCSSSRAAWS